MSEFELCEADASTVLEATALSRRLNDILESSGTDPIIAAIALRAASFSLEQMCRDQLKGEDLTRFLSMLDYIKRKSEEFTALYEAGGLPAVHAARGGS